MGGKFEKRKLKKKNFFTVFFSKKFLKISLFGPILAREGPMNSLSSVRSFVRSFVTHLSRNWLISFFLYFCMKLGVHKCRKVTEPDFSGKISFGPNLPKCPKSGFLDFCAKLSHYMLLEMA